MILPRYFLREAFKLSAAIVAGLFVIYLSTRFASYLGDAAAGKVAPQHITRIVMLKMLVSMKDLLPMSLFLGVFGAAVRIQSNSEWTAMRAAGLTHQQLLRPTLTMCVTAAILVGLITLVVGPRAEHTLRELREQTENEATIAGVKAGHFRVFAGGTQVFYAESLSRDEHFLEQTFVRTLRGIRDDVMRADYARIETDAESHDRFAVFSDGTSWAGRPGALDYVITEFERYALRIENREPTQFGAHEGFLLTSQLFGSDRRSYAIELQWRFALPLCTLLGPPLALLVAISGRRGHWYLGLIVSVSAYFAYTNMLGVGRALMRKQVLPVGLGLWPVHLAFLAILLLLLASQRRRLPRLRRRAH